MTSVFKRVQRTAAVLCTALLMLSPHAMADTQQKYQQMDWPELMPKDATVLPPPEINHDDPFAMPQSGNIELVTALDGKKVKIPGFVVPLEGNEQTLTSFLLVPYFGACIHVPPPPPNQIVYVDFEGGAEIQGLWDPVWIVGTLRTTPVQTELATVGYTLEGIGVEPYDESDWEDGGEQPPEADELEFEDPWAAPDLEATPDS